MTDKSETISEKEQFSGNKRAKPDVSETQRNSETAPVAKKAPVGPPKPQSASKKKSLKFESLYLSMLPKSDLYEFSYGHEEAVTHIAVSKQAEFIISGSVDGHVQFWKKQPELIEFVKDFTSHTKPLIGLSLSGDGLYLVSASMDQSFKLYDVVSFDIINMARFEFVPFACEFVSKNATVSALIAISEAESGKIHIFDANQEFPSEVAKPIRSIETHSSTVSLIRFNPGFSSVVSVDTSGIIEYWDPKTGQFPEHTYFEFKSETSLFEFVQNKTAPISLNFSADGKQFVCLAQDRQIRVFAYLTGKMVRKYDESLAVYQKLQKEQTHDRLDNIEFGRRMTTERDIDNANWKHGYEQNAVFDDSGNFIIFPTLRGIKIVNLVTNQLVRLIGKKETNRFMLLALFQGKTIGSVETNNLKLNADYDPTLFAASFKKGRIHLFTKREPDLSRGRDLVNEKHESEDKNAQNKSLARRCVIHTSLGDIFLELFHKQAPKAVENFTGHSKSGYYNSLLFHRVIRGFMIQTGDPRGDGTGGTSIWGKEFADEFNPSLRFDTAGVLGMANAGPNTNGSQFFITTVPCPHLDNHHTVFGRVYKGLETVAKIENVPTNKKNNKPRQDVYIVNVDVYFDDDK